MRPLLSLAAAASLLVAQAPVLAEGKTDGCTLSGAFDGTDEALKFHMLASALAGPFFQA